MPYGLPGAVKIRQRTEVTEWSTGRVVLLDGAIVEPLFPGADQDGWDGEWCCRVGKMLVAIPHILLQD